MAEISEAAKKTAEAIQRWKECPWSWGRTPCDSDCPVYGINCEKNEPIVLEYLVQTAIDAATAELRAEVERLRESIELKNEYIKILGNEIDDLMGVACAHGWYSRRIEGGRVLREKMAALEARAGGEG